MTSAEHDAAVSNNHAEVTTTCQTCGSRVGIGGDVDEGTQFYIPIEDDHQVCEEQVERLRKAIEHQVWWLIAGGYEHAASSVAVYLYPGSAAPLRRYAQDHPEHAKRIDEISWVPKVTT